MKGSARLALCLFVCAAAGAAAAAPVAVLPCGGEVRGVADEKGDGVSFLGVPFASPPRRFSPPTDVGNETVCGFESPLDAVQYRSECAQVVLPGLPPAGSEDCLYLNVFTNASLLRPRANAPLRPVLVFVHGGSSLSGSASTYPLQEVVSRGVVGVTVEFRVGLFGFLATPALTAEGGGSSGNYGLRDNLSALRWVAHNIASFGGDPSQVTLAGQSSGATNAVALLTSARGKGLFRGVIALSHSPKVDRTLAEAERSNVRDVVGPSGCANGANPAAELSCLRALSTAQVAALQPASWTSATDFGLPINSSVEDAAILIVDGEVVPAALDVGLGAPPDPGVALVVSHMASEIDLDPAVKDLGQADAGGYEEFVREWLEPFPGIDAARVLELYPYGAFASAQEAYEAIANDVDVLCLSHRNVAAAAAAFSAPVFSVVNAQPPSKPVAFLRAAGVEWKARYPAHIWDLSAMLHAPFLYDAAGFKPAPEDDAFAAAMLDLYVDGFVKNLTLGRIPRTNGEAYDSLPTGVIEPPNARANVTRGYHSDRCAFWNAAGWPGRYSWQN